MAATEKYYLDLLSQFYQKAVKNHPHKNILLEKKKKRLSNIVSSRQKSISNQKNTLQPQERLTLTTSLLKSRDKSVQSNQSNDSKLSIKRTKIDEYFKCSFIYESSSFVKSLMYSYLMLTANIGNVELLDYLRAKFIEQYSDYFNPDELHRIEFYWNKITTCSQRKEKFWEKTFLSSFKHFPHQFSDKLFQMTVRIKPQSLHLSNITSATIRKISQSLGYGINYYHISKKFIRSQIKQGNQIKFILSIVYIQQYQRWMVSDRPLQKPSEDDSSQKIKQNIGQNITKLLNKYEKDNLTLKKLFGGDEEPAKNLQNKVSQTELRKNGKLISLRVK